MGRNQSRLRSSIVMALFAVIVLTFVQVAVARPSMADDAVLGDDLHASLGPDGDNCQLTVTIQGNGAVSTLLANGESGLLSVESSELDAACDELVELTALPDPMYRFVSWQGVPEALQLKHTIAVGSPAEVTALFAPRKILRYEALETPEIDRDGRTVTEVPIMESVWRTLTDVEVIDTDPPVIDVWYGQTQTFGKRGLPQVWVNILGNVSDPDGDLSKLEYKLNGGDPMPLNVGGDGHRGDGLRLYKQGDFNIDIPYALLNAEANTLQITATDSLGSIMTSPVTLVYKTGNTWPLPYTVNWDSASTIPNVVQIVDGKWSKSAAGIRPVETGFDRSFALGDIATWSDYELTVPITIHSYNEEGFGPSQVAPALGIIIRWKGHTSKPDLCDQPLCGYYPNGSVAWYEFASRNSEDGQFSMWSKTNDKTLDYSGTSLTWGQTYFWKIRSQSLDGTTGRYRMKIWHSSDSEPDEWLLTRDGIWDSYPAGSALLLSHHVDVTFGNISVVPFDATAGPPEISGVEVIPEPKGATISWFTDEPAKSRVNYGSTAAYGESVASFSLVTKHSLYIPDLDPEMEYHFMITSKDSSNDSSSTEDDVFETQELISLVSDDFNTCTLDPAWIFVNPLASGSYEVNGTQVEISVPAGSNHDIWPPGPPVNRAPRLMRPVTDPNNLKVKFISGIDVEIAQQGILVEQDEENFLRINYQFENGHMKLVVIGFKTGAQPEILRNVNLNGASPNGPFYTLLTREKGQWQVAYSTDDENWSEVGAFSFPLVVTQAGLYAGNVNKTPGSEPAFTTAVDYYFDANAPIVPEDANPLHLPVTIVGGGTVTSDPTCGNPVTLTAEADPGWHFVEWRGSPIHEDVSLQVTTPFEYGDEVAAIFAVGAPETYTLDVQEIGQGSVTLNPDKSEYVRGEVVELTAEPADGWIFDSWGGALSGTEPVQQITMDDDKIVTANFSHAELNIAVTIVGPGQVQLSPQGPYDYGEEVTLMAVPVVGSLATFVGWSGDVNNTDNPLILNITDDMALTATFVIYKQFLPFIASPAVP